MPDPRGRKARINAQDKARIHQALARGIPQKAVAETFAIHPSTVSRIAAAMPARRADKVHDIADPVEFARSYDTKIDAMRNIQKRYLAMYDEGLADQAMEWRRVAMLNAPPKSPGDVA
jgi:hypothetical protein